MITSLPKKRFFISHGQKVRCASGRSISVRLRSPSCIADAHSHIENSSCVPMPLLDYQLPFKPDLRRKVFNVLATIFIHKGGKLQTKSTTEIARLAIDEMQHTFGPQSPIGKSELYSDKDLFTFQVIQMMDMEYANTAGFKGETIYHEDETPWYYYKRKSAKDRGKKTPLPGENQKTFTKWDWQLKETKEVLKLNPLRIFAMYHYDPRRWNYQKDTPVSPTLEKGPWDFPFSEIATYRQKGLFVGFKLYPPLGYKPLDYRLPYMHDKATNDDCFYARCEREQIPILAHCAPGGMSTHEIELYMELDEKQQRPSIEEHLPDATRKELFNPKKYFWAHYVHPRAWREVLARFPSLKICLAHFGGKEWDNGAESDWITEIISLTRDFPNVYTDISCCDISRYSDLFSQVLSCKRNSHLHGKILFGTDWFLTLVAMNGKSYGSFCEDFWDFFGSLPDGMKLWQRVTFVNPFRFYGFTTPLIIENIATEIEKLKADTKTLYNNLSSFRRLIKEFNKLNCNIESGEQ